MLSDMLHLPDDHPLITVINYSIGAAAISTPFWLRWLYEVSELAALLTPIGGLALVIMQVVLTRRRLRKLANPKPCED